jgi:transketolase
MRKAFAQLMIEIARQDPKMVLLIGDISHYLLKDFESEFPDRFYNIGICEQSMVGVAAGLAMEGYRPVIHTIAPFCVERAYEQIKVDLCYQELDVTIVSVGSSFDYAHLGCTHHCYEDISILRPLPNIDLFVPGTSSELKNLMINSWNNGKAKYFKLSKTEHSKDLKIMPYEIEVLNKGKNKVALFVNGHLLDEVYKIDNFEKYTIVYCPTIEPLSKNSQKQICQILKDHKLSITIEENSTIGSFGDKIFDLSSANDIPVLIKKIGIPRKFCTNYGTAEQHRNDLGLNYKNIQKIIKEALRNV